MIKPIVQEDHPALREIAEPIEPKNITSPEIQELIQNMHDSLATQSDGVALAGPQIAVTKRIFVVAPFIFQKPEEAHLTYINPKITYSSKENKWRQEGCLSCRWKIGEVERDLEVTIEAYDENGNKFIERGDGLLAHIFQHETDHLEGILFVDKARDLRDMTSEEIAEIEEGK